MLPLYVNFVRERRKKINKWYLVTVSPFIHLAPPPYIKFMKLLCEGIYLKIMYSIGIQQVP